MQEELTTKNLVQMESTKLSKGQIDYHDQEDCSIICFEYDGMVSRTNKNKDLEYIDFSINPKTFPMRLTDGPLFDLPPGHGFYWTHTSGRTWQIFREANDYHGPEGVGICRNEDFLVHDPDAGVREGCAIGMTSINKYCKYEPKYDRSRDGNWYYQNLTQSAFNIGWFVNDNTSQFRFYRDNRGRMNMTVCIFRL